MLSYSIPYPFLFNPWKHHLSWIIYYLQYLKSNSEDQKSRIKFIELIKSINSNYIDIYTGLLSPEQVIQAIHNELMKLHALKIIDFCLWVNNNEFQLVTINDGSIWVLRKGLEKDRYIHVHPARNKPNSIRVHGNSWKTAVVVKIFDFSDNMLNKQTINEIRKKHLSLSPIKNLNKSLRLLHAMKLLSI